MFIKLSEIIFAQVDVDNGQATDKPRTSGVERQAKQQLPDLAVSNNFFLLQANFCLSDRNPQSVLTKPSTSLFDEVLWLILRLEIVRLRLQRLGVGYKCFNTKR